MPQSGCTVNRIRAARATIARILQQVGLVRPALRPSAVYFPAPRDVLTGHWMRWTGRAVTWKAGRRCTPFICWPCTVGCVSRPLPPTRRRPPLAPTCWRLGIAWVCRSLSDRGRTSKQRRSRTAEWPVGWRGVLATAALRVGGPCPARRSSLRLLAQAGV